jgi:hypothetical protein
MWATVGDPDRDDLDLDLDLDPARNSTRRRDCAPGRDLATTKSGVKEVPLSEVKARASLRAGRGGRWRTPYVACERPGALRG